MNNQSTQLPTSIELIGWYFIAISALIIFIGLLFSFGFNLIASIFDGKVENFPSFLVGVFFILIALIPLFLGRGILARSKTVWYITFILTALSVLGAITRINQFSLFPLLIHGFIVWKLFEYRKLFGI